MIQPRSTQALSDDITAQLSAQFSQTIPLLPKSFSRVLAKIFSGVFVMLYKYAGFIFLQVMVRYASAQTTEIAGEKVRPLVELGRLFGVADPVAATPAQLTVSIPVFDQTGILKAGTKLLRSDTGVVYSTLDSVDLNAPVIQVPAIAAGEETGGTGAGEIGNLPPGSALLVLSAPDEISDEASVVSLDVPGVSAESADAYRTRIFTRVQAIPEGGAPSHYRKWALTVDGIVAAYPTKSSNPGEVDVYVEASEASSGSPDGIPTGAQLAAVAAYINEVDPVSGQPKRRPANDAVNVLPITRTAFDVEVGRLVADGKQLNAEAAINQGVDEYLRSREPFIVGLSVLPRDDRITATAVGGVVDDIISSLGGTVETVKLKLNGSEIDEYTLTAGEKAKLKNGEASFV